MQLFSRLRPLILPVLLGVLAAGCSPLPKEYYCYYVPKQGLWGERMCILYPLLVTQSERQHHAELLLRLDSRMRQSDHRLILELQRGGRTLTSDTLRLSVADPRGEWSQAGVHYHEYRLPLARALQIRATGLYQLRLRHLDGHSIAGVAGVGIYVRPRVEPRAN